MAPALPKTFAIKSPQNNKYLAYIPDDGMIQGYLKFSAKDLSTDLTKFEAVESNSGDGLVHIKCSYNNKYWRRWSSNLYWIAATADAPDENTSKWFCTLFEPVFVNGDARTLQLRHVHLRRNAFSSAGDYEPYTHCLSTAAKARDGNKIDTFTIIDLTPSKPEPPLKRPEDAKPVERPMERPEDARPTKRPEHAKPIERPGDAKPIEKPEDAKPTERPEDAKPIERPMERPEDSKPTKRPEDAKPIERPEDSKPTKKPEDAKPIERPMERPEDSKPTKRPEDAKPIERPIERPEDSKPTKKPEDAKPIERPMERPEDSKPTKRPEDATTDGELTETDEHSSEGNKSPPKKYEILDVKFDMSGAKISPLTSAKTPASVRNDVDEYTEKNMPFNTDELESSANWKSLGENSKIGEINADIVTHLQSQVPVVVDEKNVKLGPRFDGPYIWGQDLKTECKIKSNHMAIVPPNTRLEVTLTIAKASVTVPFSYTRRDIYANGEMNIYKDLNGLYQGQNIYKFTYSYKTKK